MNFYNKSHHLHLKPPIPVTFRDCRGDVLLLKNPSIYTCAPRSFDRLVVSFGSEYYIACVEKADAKEQAYENAHLVIFG